MYAWMYNIFEKIPIRFYYKSKSYETPRLGRITRFDIISKRKW